MDRLSLNCNYRSCMERKRFALNENRSRTLTDLNAYQTCFQEVFKVH